MGACNSFDWGKCKSTPMTWATTRVGIVIVSWKIDLFREIHTPQAINKGKYLTGLETLLETQFWRANSKFSPFHLQLKFNTVDAFAQILWVKGKSTKGWSMVSKLSLHKQHHPRPWKSLHWRIYQVGAFFSIINHVNNLALEGRQNFHKCFLNYFNKWHIFLIITVLF